MTLRLVGGKDVAARSISDRAFNRRVGAILSARREAAGISRAAVAAELLCDEAQVYRYEKGVTPLKVITAIRFCHFIKLDAKELFR